MPGSSRWGTLEAARSSCSARAHSAHNRLHVNARTQCRFAQSYISAALAWKIPCDEPRRFLRDRALPRAAGPGRRGLRCSPANAAASRSAAVPSPARRPTSKTGGEEAGTQFVLGTRAYSAHNRFHVTPTHSDLQSSYPRSFGYEPTINSDISDVHSAEAMWGGGKLRHHRRLMKPMESCPMTSY